MRTSSLLPVLLFLLPVSAMASGQAVYERHCAQCHSSGDVAIPQIGSQEQWQFRSRYGAESLLYSVRNGHNVMPPHEGVLRDADIEAAIDYLVTRSGGWAKR